MATTISTSPYHPAIGSNAGLHTVAASAAACGQSELSWFFWVLTEDAPLAVDVNPSRLCPVISMSKRRYQTGDSCNSASLLLSCISNLNNLPSALDCRTILRFAYFSQVRSSYGLRMARLLPTQTRSSSGFSHSNACCDL